MDAAANVVDAVIMTKAVDAAAPMAVHHCILFACLFGCHALDSEVVLLTKAVYPAVVVIGAVLVTKVVNAAVPVGMHVIRDMVLALVDPAAVSVAVAMTVHWALMSDQFTREQAESMGVELGR